MRLVWFEIDGYGRLGKSSVNLDARVVAVLGANESGKTTLLRALEELNHNRPIDARRLTRGESPGTAVCSGWFLLDAEERAALTDRVPEARSVRWYVLSKSADGERTHKLHPRPKRSIEQREGVRQKLTALLALRWAKHEDRSELRDRVSAVVDEIDSKAGTLEPTTLGRLEELAGLLAGADNGAPKRLADIAERIGTLVEYERTQHPDDRALEFVDEWSPDFLMFEEEDRILESDYDLNAVAASPPPALKNLSHAAKLDLPELLKAVAAGRPEIVEDLLTKANTILAEVFGAAWSQANVEVRLKTDNNVLRVFVRSDDGDLHRVAERSDGLKIFVCLVSFLTAHKSSLSRSF